MRGRSWLVKFVIERADSTAPSLQLHVSPKHVTTQINFIIQTETLQFHMLSAKSGFAATPNCDFINPLKSMQRCVAFVTTAPGLKRRETLGPVSHSPAKCCRNFKFTSNVLFYFINVSFIDSNYQKYSLPIYSRAWELWEFEYLWNNLLWFVKAALCVTTWVTVYNDFQAVIGTEIAI